MAANKNPEPVGHPKHVYTVPLPIPITSDDEKFWHLLTGVIFI